MSSPYSILDNRPIDQWKVTELKEELKRRKLTTKGLKEDLVKRLDEVIRAELVAEDANNGSDIPQSELQSDQDRKGSGTANDVTMVSHPKMLFEEGKTEPFVSRAAEAAMDNSSDNTANVDGNMPEDIDGSRGSVDEVEVSVGEGLNAGDFAPTEEKQIGQIPMVEPAVVVGETVAPLISSNGQDLQHGDGSGDFKPRLEKDDLSSTQLGDDSSKPPHEDNGESRSPHANVSIISSGPSNQVSLVSPALGLEVKSDSVSSESISINENNELKDKIIADDIKLEPDVKPDSMQPSSSPIVPDDSKSNPMDVGEPHESKSSIEETGGKETGKVEIAKKDDSGDISSGEKLNLDRSSGDDFMEEDVLESKQGDSKSSSAEMGDKIERVEASRVKEDALVDIVGDEVSADTEVAVSAKRKLHDQSAVENNDVRKRQRRWNSESVKLPGTQSACAVASTTPKDTFDPTLKRSFSKSESTASEEAPKERVVPPSSKPPTNSLRIDRFLRPFTLKAVQDLLGKTGTVTSFWMDHIKTHCYVSYSSVEEAIVTRNAVYNLQWPTNGGRLLIAEFVDPEEVKARIEAPPQSPATPASMTPSFPRVPPTGQPQPSPRQQVQRQQLPPPPSSLPLPPPPLLSNPPPARENPPLAKDQLPPARERPLPPPPPIPEKVDPPIVTLDDLFRKTKATPRIYYLPLSDERVAAKLKAQGRISGSRD